MKAMIVLMCGVVLSAGSLHAQELKADAVPASVKEALTKAYPTARGVRWAKGDDAGYEAEFKADKRKYEVEISAAGEIIEAEEEIRASALPAAVRAAIEAQFAGYRIEEAAKVTSKDVIAYEVELEKGKGKNEEEVETSFDANGKLLSQERSTDEAPGEKDADKKDTDKKKSDKKGGK